ncbi:MAG: hypothetical protein ABIP51_16225 [Bacteroidia bacterium]
MDKAGILRVIEDRIKAIDASEFQDLCDRLLIKLYPDYTQVRAGGKLGDMKNDGYCYVSRIFFQAHASRGETISKIKTKIETDLNGCLAKQNDVQKFVYITNDVLVGEIEAFVDGLRKTNTTLKIETWSPLKICTLISDFGIDDIEQIISRNLTSGSVVNNTLNQQNNYISLALSEEEDLGIIEEIFKFISQLIVIKNDLNDSGNSRNEKLKKLLEKIKINFNEVQQETIRNLFSNLWTRTQLVQKYIENQIEMDGGEEMVLALKDDIQAKFLKTLNVDNTDVEINDINLFETISIEYVPKAHVKNVHYTSNAKAIVLYFFELCDIGKKTTSETELKQNDLFSGL